MTTIQLATDSISSGELADVLSGVQYFVPLVKPNVSVTTAPTPGAEVVHITEQKRKVGASGYHIMVNGVPTAFVSPAASGGYARLWGHYTPALWTRGVKVLGKQVVAPRLIHGEIFTPGLITVVCHEIAELLADGNVTTYTAPDSKGRAWLLEPADWVFGTYFVKTMNTIPRVFPNVALDAFHTLGAPGPYDLCNVVKAPFQLTPKGYAYWESPTGLIPVS